jgi:hypothetical protein
MEESCDSWIPVRLLRASDWLVRGFDLPLGCVLTW